MTNKVRAVLINREQDAEKRAALLALMRTLGIDDYTLVSPPQGEGEKADRAAAHRIAWNDQKTGVYTIIFSEDAILNVDIDAWEQAIHNLPAEEDYDILYLSDCCCEYTSTPFPKVKAYSEHYLHVPLPSFDLSATPAYIVHPRMLPWLNADIGLTVSADDYLNDRLNMRRLKALTPRESLFSYGPERYTQAVGAPKTFKLLFYTKMWDMDEKLTGIPRKKGFEWLSDPASPDAADVVVFHLPTLSKEDSILKEGRKKPGQLWVGWSMECERHYPWQVEPEIAGLFDSMMTYKIDSDIPVPYIDPIYVEWLRRAPVAKTGLVNAFISGDVDQSGRTRYLTELMRHIDIHSYGKRLNNRRLENDTGIFSKATAIAGYKFSIAFENAIAPDYVTEKFFHPLIMGSVPVYLGAPNIADFAPGDHCYIDVNDFGSVKALADYLVGLDQDEARYQAYFNWKSLPFHQTFLDRANIMLRHPFIRLYEWIAERGR